MIPAPPGDDEERRPRPPAVPRAREALSRGRAGDRRVIAGWGRAAGSVATIQSAGSDTDLARSVLFAGTRGLLARGMGSSYGDAAQNGGGLVLDMTQRRRILSVDASTGDVTLEAGVTLDELMRVLLPLGLFPPVSPGTRQITVGGAIAADVHGKNHHIDGSFGQHVTSIDLMVADGSIRRLTAADDLFWATVGGMGLTGLLLRATVRMKRVGSAYCVVDTERASDLDDVLARMSGSDSRYTYSAAWVDCVSGGRSLGRSVLSRGWFARADQLPPRLRPRALRFEPRRRLAAPHHVPGGLMNRSSVAVFNEAWYRHAPVVRRGEVQPLSAFLHPLDGVRGWNRLYGPRGFLQYQFVVPLGAEDTLRHCIETLARSGHTASLGVLKRFGPASRGYLSFPTDGWTLTLDIPLTSPRLGPVLDRLDRAVLRVGGRQYLAKDSRMPPDAVPRMYPRLSEWRAVRRRADPGGVFMSDLARRLQL